MKTVENILMKFEECCRMEIHPPASTMSITEMKTNHPFVPSQVLDPYRITDGMEIGMTGTEFYPVREVQICKYGGESSPSFLEIGRMSFGDRIAVTPEGKIALLDHENDYTVQLEWDSLVDFLADELSALD